MTAIQPSESLRILCIDGGGIKGYTALLILKRIFRTLQDVGELDEEPRPCDVFDLIAGTSTGGLIAVMLGRLHMTIDECIKQYEAVGERVFGKRPPALGKLLRGMVNSPFYNIETLQEEIRKALDARGIAREEAFRETGVPRCKVMLCVTRRATSKPDVLRNYVSLDPTQENYQCNIWEAASATAAAPMYFKHVQFDKSGGKWCDGGLRRNNPINEAVLEVHREKIWKDKQIGCLVSLGTGIAKVVGVSANLAVFLKGSVDIMTDSEDLADEFAASKLGRELAEAQRYFRFSVPQGLQDLELDECKENEKMSALTMEYLRKVGSGNDIKCCAESLLHPDENLQIGNSAKPSLLPYSTCVHFVDRLRYAEELHSFFKLQQQDQQIFVLWGLGGVGKTQIALKFAQTTKYRHSVFWVRANNFTNFANDYARILKILDPTTVEVPSQSNRIIEVFEKTVEKMEEAFSSWLLILDNADDLDQFIDQSEEQNRIIRYLPKKGRILLTTRDRRFQGIFAAASSGVQVKPMSNDEAMTLLHRSVASRLVKEEKYSSNSGASELLEELGNLPLAIGQAAANIRELQLTVEQYVVSYRDKSQRMGLMQEPVRDLRTTDPRTSSQSVAVTLELSFEYLEKRHPLSAALLCYLGFCNWQNVPEFLILAMPEFRNLQHLAFRDVVKRLLHLSLAEEGMEASVFPIYHIHPVVHERISTRLSPDEQRRYFSPMVAYMAYTFPFVGSENDTEFKICRYLIPHAIHQVWAGSTLSVIDRSYARLLQVVSNFLSLSGLTRDAVALSRRAMDIAAKVWDKDDPSILYVRKTMIECLKNHDLYGDAEIEIGKALLQLESDALQAALSTEKLVSERSGVLIDLVACLGGLNRYEEMEKVIRDQLAGDLQERSKHWALFRNSLALCLLKQDRVKDAQQVNDEMVTFAETMEGKGIISRTDYLAMLELRGFILRRLRILDQAPANVVTPDYQDILVHIAVFQESLETFGIGNTSTWRFANHSIGALLDSKRLDKATGILETLLKAAIVAKLRIEGTLLSKFHITFSLAIRLIRDLATASDREQRLGSARFEGLLLDAITTAGLGLEEILESYDVLNTYGALCQCRGDFCFAETLHRQALEKALQENKLIDVGIIYYNIMLAIARQPGRVAEAYAFREQHLAALNRVEAVNGDLNKQLSRFEHDRSIYEQAQNKLRLGQLAVGDTWWKEHDDALKRAEVMYGFLVPPQPEPSIHVPPVQVELMASKRLKISISSITTALRFRRP